MAPQRLIITKPSRLFYCVISAILCASTHAHIHPDPALHRLVTSLSKSHQTHKSSSTRNIERAPTSVGPPQEVGTTTSHVALDLYEKVHDLAPWTVTTMCGMVTHRKKLYQGLDGKQTRM